jgi:iron complex transport system ATP-binding protein
VRGPEGLRAESVSAGYGGLDAVTEVTVGVRPGEVLGLIGPNGSGKTTLVRVASRTLRPHAGRVLAEGRDLYETPARAAARLVAVVPQELSPTFAFTVLEIVLMGRAAYQSPWGGGGPDDYARAREAMEVAGVLHLADRPVTDLSGGEKQRTVLAQALAQDAPILLLDEPTTHLDPGHVVTILETVRRLVVGGGAAVLAVFHDLNLASTYCDRLVALSGGRVVAEGPPEEVITPGFLRSVYGVEAEVHPHFATGRPVVLPGPPLAPIMAPGSVRAHVVGGAGRGGPIMRALAERGYDVTVGALHSDDTDAVVAERLNLARVAVPPFSPVDTEAEGEVESLMVEAALVVVCDAPFGPGNVGNLRAAVRAAERGARIVLIEGVPIRDRDFTNGRATELWGALAELGESLGGYEELLGAVDATGGAGLTDRGPADPDSAGSTGSSRGRGPDGG